MRNIIIIQLARLGDIIQTIPLIEDIKTNEPESNIFLFVNDVFKDCEIFLNKVSVIPIVLEDFVSDDVSGFSQTPNYNHKKEYTIIFEELSKKNAIVINLNNSPISKYIANILTSDKKFGFGMEPSSEWSAFINSFLKTRHLNSINLVDIFKGFLQLNKDYEFNTSKKYKTIENKSLKNQIGIQCGARNLKRQFTLQHYLDIANYYLQKDYKVYLLGLPSESKIAKTITDNLYHENLINSTGKTNIQELIDIISSCEKIYTPDTGTMHLAAFCGTPISTLFCGPAYPFETLAYTPKAEVFIPNKDIITCYPCRDDDICPNNFQCRNFSFQNVFTEIENENFIRLSVNYDEIGQVLSPIDEMAFLWREFAKFYFYDNKVLYNYSFDTLKIKKNIQREIKLWDMIDINDIKIAEINLYFLKPLIFYNKLSQNKTLIQEALKYFSAV